MDPERIANVLRELDADIVALQEVDARDHPQGYVDQWQYLAAATGYRCIPGISLRTHRSIFGNALLLRGKETAVRLHDLSVPGREPRGAIDLLLDLETRLLRVVATHLGLRGAERREQAGRLARILESETGDAQATILLGDLNEWHPRLGSLAQIFERFSDATALRTFPARYPLLALDRILVRGGLRLTRSWVHRSRLARRASDHLPLCAEAQAA